jgi:hypothetical protein
MMSTTPDRPSVLSQTELVAPTPGVDATDDLFPGIEAAPGIPIAEKNSAIQHAYELATFAFTTYWDSTKFPVNPMEIAKKLGVTVREGPLNKDGVGPQDLNWISGTLYKPAGTVHGLILLEQSEKTPRQRFTLMHELIHWIEETKGKDRAEIRRAAIGQPRYPNQGNINLAELLANSATHLVLMPEFAVTYLRALEYDDAQMAEFFDVSLESVAIRRHYSFIK